MKINKIEDIKALAGGVDIDTLEALISQLLQIFSLNKIPWTEGIEALNDLIYLKKQDGSVLSKPSSKLILDWIEQVYDSNIFEGFDGVHEEGDKKSEKIIFTWDLTADTLMKIRHNIDVLPFLNFILKQSSNEYEVYEIKGLIDWSKELKGSPKQVIPDEVLDRVLSRTDAYFELANKAEEGSPLLCGLRETVREYKLCYTIAWCIKTEKYVSSVKRTRWVGAGALMVSKLSDQFERMGSAPGIDWVHLFELKIQELEEYFYLEIPYKKEHVSKLKSALNCSTSELLKMLNQEKKITYTEAKKWNDHYPDFQHIADDLNKSGIECQVEIKTRKKH